MMAASPPSSRAPRRWIALRRTAQAEKRLAIVLSAYPGRDDQMAHAVGLDAPRERGRDR